MTLQFAQRGDKKQLEDSLGFAPKFDSSGLIPVVATDHKSGDVLMFAFMNEETLRMSIEIGEAVYWSRSRSELWHKGKTSGNIQKIVEMRTDCDQDAIWIRVEQIGNAACHTGRNSCFYRGVPLGAESHPGEEARLILLDDTRHFDPEQVYGKK